MHEPPSRIRTGHAIAGVARRIVWSGLIWAAFSGPAGALDLNAANRSELEQLPRIGVTQAELILQERERNGPFASWEDFRRRVRGYGKKSIEHLKAQGVSIAPEPAARIEAPAQRPTESRP